MINDKTAIITGGGKGIGRAISLKLAKDGFNICINEIDKLAAEKVVTECKAIGVDSCSAICDISIPTGAKECVNICNHLLGGPSVLINNAAQLTKMSFLSDFEELEFDSTFNVNVKGLLNMVKASIPIMKEKRWGRVINATSMYGIHPQVGRGLYSASKAAVISITKVLAAELAPYKITVNAYAPGTIETKMAKDSLKQEKLLSIPLREYGLPEDVANLVSFLVDNKSSYITGTVIGIDGGSLSVQDPSRAWEQK